MLGPSNILLFDDMAVLEVLVHPKARRTDVGRELLAAAVRRAHEEGFTSMGVEVIGGTSAAQFYESIGFTCAYTETRSVLELSTVDWLRLGEMAGGVGSGYRIEYHPGGPPEELYESLRGRQIPRTERRRPGRPGAAPEFDERAAPRASLKTLHMRGMKPHIVVGIHESTGEVAALTEVVVAAQHPDRADQYDTIVVPEHRGYGLTRAIKARMLFELRSAEPRVQVGADVERARCRGHADRQRRAGLQARPGVARIRGRRPRAGRPPGRGHPGGVSTSVSSDRGAGVAASSAQ